MTDSRAHLLARKHDLFAALRALEQDHEDGAMDQRAYAAARQRFEWEAATILQQLDALGAESVRAPSPVAPASAGPRRTWLAAGAMSALIAAALVIFLVSAAHGRATGQSITGAQPAPVATPAAQPAPGLLAAERAIRARPRSVDALLTLGAVYTRSGNAAAADRAYVRAMQVDPNRPEPPTLHALILASAGHFTPALKVLRSVERAHPRYARAWLTDGLIASRRRPGFPRAIAAWKRFLALDPHGQVSGDIRASLASLERAQGAGR